MTLSPDVTVIIKVTNACDLQCRYCFIEPAVFHKTMKDHTATRVIRAFLDSSFFRSVHFVWHGGEPLLRGRRFFERVFAEQRSRATRVSFTNSTQTNATHLDDDMMQFLLANQVSIGLSLDGPEQLTDASRRTRRALPVLAIRAGDTNHGGCGDPSGGCGDPGAGCADSGCGCGCGDAARARGTTGLTDPARPGNPDRPGGPANHDASLATGGGAHRIAVDAARRLQQRGRQAAAIVTVNRNNVDHPEAVYAEFQGRRIHMRVNPLTRSGLADTPLGADLGVSAEEYGRFMVRLFDAWYDHPEPRIRIEPFGQHIARILGEQVTHSCFYTRSCHRFFLGISPDGDLFPCGMFQGEPSFGYGNIHDLRPEDIAGTLLYADIDERERHVLRGCARCPFVDLCYGGCMFHSLKDSKILAEKDYYCAGYAMYFEHVLRRLHADLTRVPAGRVEVPAGRAA